MVIPADIEIRPDTDISPKERAEARDSFVQEFERQFSNWVDIARVCSDIERDKDYLLLGFSSYHAWLIDRAPRSRSYIYLVTNRYRELIVDIPEEELAQIPLGSAGVLKQLSSKIRQDPEVRKAARKKPSELRQAVRESHPEMHIEGLDARTLDFTESQAAVWDEMLACYRQMNNHSASAEEAAEWIASQWLDGPWEDSGYSNRERAKQIGSYDQEGRSDNPDWEALHGTTTTRFP